MTKNDRIFVDGMANVKMLDGVVHITFFNNVNDIRENCGEICMSQQSFLNAFGTMEDLVNQLINAGLVHRNTENKAEKNINTTSASPNFE